MRLSSGSLLVCGALLFSTVAHADLYHAVAPGETLGGIAAKYGVSADSLRVANGLQESNAATLGAMLLRVPGVGEKSNAKPILASTNGKNATTLSSGSGFLSRTMSETVRTGDSWETIAARYRAAGHDVSVDALRKRNAGQLPAAGQTVVVPLGQVTVSAPAPQVKNFTNAAPVKAAITPSRAPSTPATNSASKPSAPRALGGGVYTAQEADLPVAKTFEAPPPVFAPNSGAANRGSLSSRGGFSQMARSSGGGAAPVVRQNEATSAPRANTTAARPVATPKLGDGIARVAKVNLTGATIRRLAEASAVTLFKPGVGTQLAVMGTKSWWSAVLMSDGSTGWIPTKYLAMTDQMVDVSAQIRESEGVGGAARYSVGKYSTESRTVAEALRWLGTRYVYGGTSRRGIDCSALVQNSFRACGIKLPRTAATQAKVGKAVATEDLKPGDRLYFSASGTRIDHTGLYMGDGLFVHASGSGRRVMVSSLFEKRNWNIYVGARR